MEMQIFGQDVPCMSRKLCKFAAMQEVTKQEQPRWNGILVEVFSTFISFCTRHQLRYFCAGGTAIGAVRHQGMIP